MSSAPRQPFDGSDGGAALALAALASAVPDARILGRSTPRPARANATRKRRLARLGSGSRLNLTAMIDVVFLLLVFFIATTRFVSNEDVLRMDLPPRTVVEASSTAAAPDPFAYIEDALHIQVENGGRVRAGAPVSAATDARELRGMLEAARRDSANPAGSLPVAFPIVIEPAVGATWQDAIEVLNAAAGAGYTNVSFAQKPGERAP